MPKYIKAEPGPEKSVIYTDVNGKQWKFEGGNRPWRNQNPGNLIVGKISKRNGAIGRATIQAYQIEGYGWVSKDKGIQLVLQGKVDAVVATSPRGNAFLRARPNNEIFDNLDNKG